MKKAVKAIIAASAVAAVVGVGAVSFAAWSGTNTSATVNGETAKITTIGLAGSLTNSTLKLIPWNQVEGASNASYTKEYVVELTLTGDSIADKDIQVTYTGTLASGSNYMVKFDASDSTAATTVAATTGYANILTAASGTAKYDITGEESGKVYAHIILDSSNTADMEQSVTFTFELVDHTA